MFGPRRERLISSILDKLLDWLDDCEHTRKKNGPGSFSSILKPSCHSLSKTDESSEMSVYHLTEEGHCCSKLFQHTINFVRLLVSVTLEKREGTCALFVQKTPDMFTNLPSARKTLLESSESQLS